MSDESDPREELYNRVRQIARLFNTEVYFTTLTPLAIRAGMIDDGNPYFVFKFPAQATDHKIAEITKLLEIELKRGASDTPLREKSAA